MPQTQNNRRKSLLQNLPSPDAPSTDAPAEPATPAAEQARAGFTLPTDSDNQQVMLPPDSTGVTPVPRINTSSTPVPPAEPGSAPVPPSATAVMAIPSEALEKVSDNPTGVIAASPFDGAVTDPEAVADIITSKHPAQARLESGARRRQALMRDQSDENRRRRMTLGFGVVVVVLLVALAGFMWWRIETNKHEEAAWEAAHADVPVTLGVLIPETELCEQGSKIPLTVSGTDLDGNALDQTAFVNWDGSGLSLMQGSYTVSVPASPIGSDGTLFSVPTDKLQITIAGNENSDDPDTASASVDVAGSLVFTEIDGLDVTDDDIAAAYDYASQGGAPTSEDALALRTAAQKKRDEAKAAHDEQEAEKRAKERAERLVSADDYEFELPDYWKNKVTVKQDGDTTVFYSKDDDRRRLCTIMVMPTDEIGESTVGNALIYQTPVDDENTLTVWTPRWGYLIAQAKDEAKNSKDADEEKESKSEDTEKDSDAEKSADDKESSPATDDEVSDKLAETLVDLQTGGTATYAEMKSDYEKNGDKGQSYLAGDDFIASTIVDSLELK